jgi:hypothetical protein
MSNQARDSSQETGQSMLHMDGVAANTTQSSTISLNTELLNALNS